MPGAADDDERHRELHRGGAEVAARRVEAERAALLLLRVEERDVRHRRGEVAAADAGERRDREQDREAELGVLHGDRERDGRRRAAAARRRWSSCGRRRSGPRTCTGCAASRRRGSGSAMSQNIWSTVSTKPAAGSCGTTMLHSGPDGEAEELGEDRQPEVAAGDRPTDGGPLAAVLGVPAVDPAAGAVGERAQCRERGSVPASVASCVAMGTSGRTGSGGLVDDDARQRMFRPTCPIGCAHGSFRAPVAAGACEIRRADAPARARRGRSDAPAHRRADPAARPAPAAGRRARRPWSAGARRWSRARGRRRAPASRPRS